MFTENFDGPPKLALRLSGTSVVAPNLVITCDRAAKLPGSAAEDQGATLTLTLPSFTTRNGTALLPKVHAIFADHLDARAGLAFSRRDPALSFAAHRLRALTDRGSNGATQARPDRTDLDELMALYSGLTSIEEALQTDRALRVGPSAKSVRDNLPLSSLSGVALPSHPWAQMLAELPSRPTPVIEPLAAAVPADMIYLHFVDLWSLSALARDLDAWVSPFVHAVEGSSGVYDVAARYEAQLIVERARLSEALGHLAARGVALVTSDSLLREGTDVSLLFDAPNLTLIEPILDGFVNSARADLQALSSTALLHTLFEGGLPSDRAALSRSPFVSAPDLIHADGQELRYDAKHGPRSAFGSLGALVP
ncbi:MAG: hypothetical protein EXR76_19420, partial [Myxococcales bacterium]|nr:hypothetical protein [Myxococcales bacterium]